MLKIREMSTISAVAVLVAASTVAIRSILPSSFLSSQQAYAQSNVTQEAASSANQTGEEMQSGMANTTQEAKSSANQTGEKAQSTMNKTGEEGQSMMDQTGEALQNINPFK
jgi:hypothetical protein